MKTMTQIDDPKKNTLTDDDAPYDKPLYFDTATIHQLVALMTLSQ
jgi:hypothetical protein